MKQVLCDEQIVTWIRIESRDGARKDDLETCDFDVILMNNDGEISHIKDIKMLDDWEYSHCAFQRDVWTEEQKEEF